MRHPEVAETPGKRRENGDPAVAAGFRRLDIGAGKEVQITGNRSGIGNDGVPAAGCMDAENENDNQREGHDHALDQAGDGGRHEAAHGAVSDDDNGGDDHGNGVVPAEHAVEQLAAGDKAGSGIGNKEDDNDQSADGLDQLGVIPKARCQKIRNRDGVELRGIDAQSAGDDQPVEIGARSKADGSPAGFRDAAEQRQARDAHQQISAHVRGLGAHGRGDRAELASAEVKVRAVAGTLGMAVPDEQHADQIDDDGEDDEYG